MRFRRRPVAVATDEPDDGLRAYVTGNEVTGYVARVEQRDGWPLDWDKFATADEARTHAAKALARIRAEHAVMAATRVDEVIR